MPHYYSQVIRHGQLIFYLWIKLVFRIETC